MINNRYDFVMLFDVENGNPNGDPDNAGAPRMDTDSGYGLVTDVCIKRKIRNYVDLLRNGEPSYNILIKPGPSLNGKFTAVYKELGLKTKAKGNNPDDVKKAKDFMCENYFDVRAFGAVMSTGDDPCGIVRGPVQINFARSVSPINATCLSITREVDAKDDDKKTIGKKNIIPYALYRAEGYVSAALANNTTGLTEDDLNLLWEAIINMFEHDHSAMRGKMCMRKLYVFRHDSIYGNCPSHILFDKIKIKEKTRDRVYPICFDDYIIEVDEDMPAGVHLLKKLG